MGEAGILGENGSHNFIISEEILQQDRLKINRSLTEEITRIEPRTRGVFTDNLTRAYSDILTNASIQGKPDEELQKLRDDLILIATKGQIRDATLLSYDQYPARRSPAPHTMLEYRALLMQIYARDPEFAYAIMKEKIVGMHGSTSASLLGVIKDGLKPHEEVIGTDGIIASGEGMLIGENDFPFVEEGGVSFSQLIATPKLMEAFTKLKPDLSEHIIKANLKKYYEKLAGLSSSPADDWNDFIDGYQCQLKIDYYQRLLDFLHKPNKTGEEQLQERLIRESFPVIYFIGPVDPQQWYPGSRNVPTEFRAEGKTDVRIVAAPKEKMEMVKNLSETHGRTWRVVDIESYLPKAP